VQRMRQCVDGTEAAMLTTDARCNARGIRVWHMRDAMRLAYARTDGRTNLRRFVLTSGMKLTFVNAHRWAA
jgi:hypothetical protein